MVVGGGGDAYKFYTPFPTPKNVKTFSGPIYPMARASSSYNILTFSEGAMYKQKCLK